MAHELPTPVATEPIEPRLGGYRIVRELMPGKTFLATTSGDREVVLKLLETDCLLGQQLHPNIKDRLGRVREIANLALANLYGVQREGGVVYLVWEYLPGVSLNEWALDKRITPRQVVWLARDLALTIEGLHARGLIHGALHENNVIVHADGARLTHVSPLLYSEASVDESALQKMFNRTADARHELRTSLACLLSAEPIPIRQWIAKLTAELQNADGVVRTVPGSTVAEDRRERRRTGLAAMVAVAAGVFFYISVRWATHLLTAGR